jgi:hypothetical protein
MPRKWSAETVNPGKSWGELEPIYSAPLTPRDIALRRWELAAEMVELMLGDGELAKRPRQALQRISGNLADIRRWL